MNICSEAEGNAMTTEGNRHFSFFPLGIHVSICKRKHVMLHIMSIHNLQKKNDLSR